MENDYPYFKWRCEVPSVELVSTAESFFVELQPEKVVSIRGCNTVSLLVYNGTEWTRTYSCAFF